MFCSFTPIQALAEITIGETKIVTINSQGQQGYATSITNNGVISDDGRLVAFTSDALDVLSTSQYQHYDLYLYDRKNDKMQGFQIGKSSHQADSLTLSRVKISADNRYVVFEVNFFNRVNDLLFDDIYILDRETKQISQVLARGHEQNYVKPNQGKVSNYSYLHQVSTNSRSIFYQSPSRPADTATEKQTTNHSGLFIYHIDSQQSELYPINLKMRVGRFENYH